MVKDGSAEWVFKDGYISTRDQFLREMKYGNSFLYVGLVDGDVAGMAWLNSFQYRHAQAHFCFFRKYWGDPVTVDLGKASVKVFFKSQDIHMLLGLLPASNEKALNFMLRIGASQVGVLPQGYWNEHYKQPEDAIILQILRSDLDESLQ